MSRKTITTAYYEPERVQLHYAAEDGSTYTQPVSDLAESGTLIDPETGEDMRLFLVSIVEKHD